jgi:predicted glycosyltransferase
MIQDYEFAKAPPFSRPRYSIVPEVIARAKLPGKNVLTYSGIKEEVYVPSFAPDPAILTELGLSAQDIVVTIRPPATEAHYHNPEGEKAFIDLMEWILSQPGTKIVLLPRDGKQQAHLREQHPAWFSTRRLIIPGQAVNGLNLIYFSDAVVSGGGTMNREAAALGVPAYSIFRGPTGAVDKYLASQGRLTLISSTDDLRSTMALAKRDRRRPFEAGRKPALEQIVEHIESIMASEARRSSS